MQELSIPYVIRKSGQMWSRTSINGHAAEEEDNSFPILMSLSCYKSLTTDVTEYIFENDLCSTESEMKNTQKS